MGDLRPTMENMADPILLEKIDKLFASGVGEHIPLPQIVVVGDQSSGKSSVLEGLTGLPFPRDSGLCTRFPTQIVFKRSKILTTEVSIMTAHGQDREVDMESFSHNILKFELSGPEYEHFSVVDLPGLFRSTPFLQGLW